LALAVAIRPVGWKATDVSAAGGAHALIAYLDTFVGG